MTLSFLTFLGGSQAQILWDFLHQTTSQGRTIRNVLTFEIDDKSMEKGRKGISVTANLMLNCIKQSRGLLSCTLTGRKFNKEIKIQIFRHNPRRITMFKPWGSTITEQVLMIPPSEIPMELHINMIPVTTPMELPFDAPYPYFTSSQISETEESEASNDARTHHPAPARTYSIFIAPTPASSSLNSTDPIDSSSRSSTSSIQSGLIVEPNTGRVDLIARTSSNPPVSTPHFTPIAASTLETPPNHRGRPESRLDQGLRLRVQESTEPGFPRQISIPPRLFDQARNAVNRLQRRSKSASPPRKKRKTSTYLRQRSTTADSRYTIRKIRIAPSDLILTNEEARANRVRNLSTSSSQVSNNNEAGARKTVAEEATANVENPIVEANSSISPIRPPTNITIELPDTPEDSQDQIPAPPQTSNDSFQGQNDDEIAFLNERMEAALAMNDYIENLGPLSVTSQIMNANIPQSRNPAWNPDPNPMNTLELFQEIMPEHVALVVDPSSNTTYRTLYFWDRRNPWDIIQSMVHSDVILYPNGQVDETPDPELVSPWSPNHISSTEATAGSTPDSPMDISLLNQDTVYMSLDSTSTGQSAISASDMSITPAAITPNAEDPTHGRGEKEKGAGGGGGHAH